LTLGELQIEYDSARLGLEPYLWLYRPDGTPRVNPTQAEVVAEGIDRSDGMLYESPALGETKRLRKIQRWNHQLAGRTGRIQIYDSASEWRGR
jgi:hypothetical protein